MTSSGLGLINECPLGDDRLSISASDRSLEWFYDDYGSPIGAEVEETNHGDSVQLPDLSMVGKNCQISMQNQVENASKVCRYFVLTKIYYCYFFAPDTVSCVCVSRRYFIHIALIFFKLFMRDVYVSELRPDGKIPSRYNELSFSKST